MPYETVDLLEKTRRAGRRVYAVGTTVARALESIDLGEHTPHGIEGYTKLTLSGKSRPKNVDALITGFHDRDSSHYRL